MNISKDEMEKLLEAKAMIERQTIAQIDKEHTQNAVIQSFIDKYGDDAVTMELDLNDLESGIKCTKLKDLI